MAMRSVPFDTHAAAKTLRDGAFSEDRSEAAPTLVCSAAEGRLDAVATKADPAAPRTDVATLRAGIPSNLERALLHPRQRDSGRPRPGRIESRRPSPIAAPGPAIAALPEAARSASGPTWPPRARRDHPARSGRRAARFPRALRDGARRRAPWSGVDMGRRLLQDGPAEPLPSRRPTPGAGALDGGRWPGGRR